jgi:hypothetical protein
MVQVKNLENVDELERILSTFGVRHYESRELGVIVLSGTPEAVAAASDAVQRLDVPRPRAVAAPRRNAEFTAFLVLARPEGEGGAAVPAAVMPAIDQLRSVFPSYKRYELLETVILRVNRQGNVSGTLPPLPGAPAQTFYEIQFGGVSIRGEPGAATVAIGELGLRLDVPHLVPAPGDGPRPPAPVNYRPNKITTSVELREGQKAVVGKSSVDASGASLILVLTAKVVE